MSHTKYQTNRLRVLDLYACIFFDAPGYLKKYLPLSRKKPSAEVRTEGPQQARTESTIRIFPVLLTRLLRSL